MGYCELAGQNPFPIPEFAFYLLVNGEKRAVRWYEKDSEVRFDWPDDAAGASISIRGFVREQGNPENKLMLTAPLGNLPPPRQHRLPDG